MEPRRSDHFIRFLREDLAIPAADLQLALQHPEQTPSLLPIILWQYGLVTLSQVNQMFDWLEQSVSYDMA